MDILENGGLSINPHEVRASVIAFDFSPAAISSSALANRLRMAARIYELSLHEGAAGIKFHAAIDAALLDDQEASKELYKQALADSSLDSAVTLVPHEDVDTLVDALLHFTELEPKRIAKYLRKRAPKDFRRELVGQDAEERVAAYHLDNANSMIDTLFPPEI